MESLTLYLYKQWPLYATNPDPVVGIFTGAVAILTLLVFLLTIRAANAAKSSTRLAQQALEQARKDSLRDDFNRQFTLLLEQHNNYLSIVRDYLDSEKGKALLNKINTATNHLNSFNELRGHPVISPYMRVLYHLLKHIHLDFYKENALLKEKKKYSSLVRSLIRNDVLFLIAVNASYTFENGKRNQYALYQHMLKQFDFFEHALFFTISSEKPEQSILAINKWVNDTETIIGRNFITAIKGEPLPSYNFHCSGITIPFIISCLYQNPANAHARCALAYMPWYTHYTFKNALKKSASDIPFQDNLEKYIDSYICYENPANYSIEDTGPKTLELMATPPVTEAKIKELLEKIKSPLTDYEESMRFVKYRHQRILMLESFSDYPFFNKTMNDFKTDVKNFEDAKERIKNITPEQFNLMIIGYINNWLKVKRNIFIQRTSAADIIE